jgi:hypothetical protein
MNLSVNDLVLLMIDGQGGHVNSKTLIMKQAYFLAVLLKRDDLGFRPHFYGPCSAKVADALGQLAFLGFVHEECTGFGPDSRGFERCRYDYSVIEDGRKIVQLIKATCPSEADAIEKTIGSLKQAASGMDYVALSYAAKTYFLLMETHKQTHKSVSPSEIREKAGTFHWRIEQHDISRSVEFLKRIGLVKTGGN